MRLELNDRDSQNVIGAILGEMLFHMSKIKEYMNGVTPDEYAKNQMMRDALSMRLQAIGELAKSLTKKGIDSNDDLKQKFPYFEWDDLKGMRDIIAHNYSRVDISFPWQAFEATLPELENIIRELCREYPAIKEATDFSLRLLESQSRTNIEDYMEFHGVSFGMEGPK